MDLKKVLELYGLEEKQAAVYLELLNLGETTATKLAERTGIDRTLMYQLTDKLIEAGLASYIIKNNVRYFSAAAPEILLRKIQEKEEQIRLALPELKARLQPLIETKVETYRGREGINTILKMIIREAQQYFIFGGAQLATTIFELENRIFVKQAEKHSIRGKILLTEEEQFFIGKNEEYRYVPKELLAATSLMLWNDKTAVFVWEEPYYAILIHSRNIMKSNLVVFEHLWALGRKPTKQEFKNHLLV